MLVHIAGGSEHAGKAGWVPNHGILNLNEGEEYEVRLKGGSEKVQVDGANLECKSGMDIHCRLLILFCARGSKQIPPCSRFRRISASYSRCGKDGI